jgi:starvation-inducible DNA-binding protein
MAKATYPSRTGSGDSPSPAGTAQSTSDAPGGKTFPTRHDIPAEKRVQLVGLLNRQLADLFDLYSQLKHAHWNVKGPEFISLHELFDQLAATVNGSIDDVAERATALGGLALGSVRMVAARTRLPEFPADTFVNHAVVTALADRYAHLAATTRKAIDEADELGDKDTADLFTEVSRVLDKSLWFLEAHLQG